MKNAQVINVSGTFKDSILAFDGDNVIDKTDQQTIAIQKGLTSPISVNIAFYDLMSVSSISGTPVNMTYLAGVDYWYISISDLFSAGIYFIDRHKYVGIVQENTPYTANMRDFKIEEFCADNESFEDTWMNLPYQVEIDTEGGTAFIRWYTSINPISAPPLFQAEAYQGGTGTTYATSAANVTHRGPIVPYLI